MKREDFEKLGDLHKSYESRTESTLMPGCPVVIVNGGEVIETYAVNE